jgi:uncharacterized protein YmfQ (DUF2313 family)
MVERWVQRTSVEYAAGWSELLPTGSAWPRDPSSVLQNVIKGQAQIWGDEVEASAALLLTTESDPRITQVLLDDWEKAWGLPDVCFSRKLTTTERQTLLVQKMTLLGAQDRAFFTAQALLVGYTVNIHEHAPYMCGIARCGNTKDLDDNIHFYWEIGQPEIRFWWGVQVTALASPALDGIDIECFLRRYKPAHTEIVFDYSPLQKLDQTQAYDSGYYLLLFA